MRTKWIPGVSVGATDTVISYMGYTITKHIEGYAYARNGNTGNPTPRVIWIVTDKNGKIMGQDFRLRDSKEFIREYLVKG